MMPAKEKTEFEIPPKGVAPPSPIWAVPVYVADRFPVGHAVGPMMVGDPPPTGYA